MREQESAVATDIVDTYLTRTKKGHGLARNMCHATDQGFEMLLDDAIEFLLLIDGHRWETMRCVTNILTLLRIGQIGQEKEVGHHTNQLRGIRQFIDGYLLLLLSGTETSENG